MVKEMFIEFLSSRDLVMVTCALVTGMIINEIGHRFFDSPPSNG